MDTRKHSSKSARQARERQETSWDHSFPSRHTFRVEISCKLFYVELHSSTMQPTWSSSMALTCSTTQSRVARCSRIRCAILITTDCHRLSLAHSTVLAVNICSGTSRAHSTVHTRSFRLQIRACLSPLTCWIVLAVTLSVKQCVSEMKRDFEDD